MFSIRCLLGSHDFLVDKWYSHSVQRIKCKRCGKRFGINHDVGALLEWDAELEFEMNRIFPEKADIPD